MNQILNIPPKKINKYIFKVQLFLSLIIILILFVYMYFLIYSEEKSGQISNSISQPYSISKLYANTISENNIEVHTAPYVIGNIEIASLGISLPVISEFNDDLLKISACRFYGPVKNSPGNICIAGHNYDNEKFFSNLPKIMVGGSILFTDLYNNGVTYIVYDKYEIDHTDTSCTSQETNGKCELTLVTCNNFTGNRIIVKAREM